MISGNLTVEAGGQAFVHGTVAGTVINNGGRVEIEGSVGQVIDNGGTTRVSANAQVSSRH
jgi:autotransporter passenger strand-loop-strand repeat protein